MDGITLVVSAALIGVCAPAFLSGLFKRLIERSERKKIERMLKDY